MAQAAHPIISQHIGRAVHSSKDKVRATIYLSVRSVKQRQPFLKLFDSFLLLLAVIGHLTCHMHVASMDACGSQCKLEQQSIRRVSLGSLNAV
jgi:hypothetical protein